MKKILLVAIGLAIYSQASFGGCVGGYKRYYNPYDGVDFYYADSGGTYTSSGQICDPTTGQLVDQTTTATDLQAAQTKKTTSANTLTSAKTDLNAATSGGNATATGRVATKQAGAQASLAAQVANRDPQAAAIMGGVVAKIQESPLLTTVPGVDAAGNPISVPVVSSSLFSVGTCSAANNNLATPACASDQSHLGGLTPEQWSAAQAQKQIAQVAARDAIYKHKQDLQACKHAYESMRFDDNQFDPDPASLVAVSPAACSAGTLSAPTPVDTAAIAAFKSAAKGRYDAYNSKLATRLTFNANSAALNKPINDAIEKQRVVREILATRAAGVSSCSILDGRDLAYLDGLSSPALQAAHEADVPLQALNAGQYSRLYCSCDKGGNNCKMDSKFVSNETNKTTSRLGCVLNAAQTSCDTPAVADVKVIERNAAGACVIDAATGKCKSITVSNIQRQAPGATAKAVVKAGAKVAYY